jgi:Peptidase S80 family
MQGAVEFSCQVLNGTNKAGSLKPNANGYYDMIVGALNMTNNKGEFYDYNYGKKFFTEASDLVRMAQKGVLRGEYGHPNQETGQSDDKFVERLLRVDEQSACCHHKRIYLDFDRYKDAGGRPIVGIMSEVYPSGPFGPPLEKSIQNGHENVCFSIRCFSMPHRVGGRVIKEMKHVVTFDYVNEPGIVMATKYDSPSLEGHATKIFSQGAVQQSARNIRSRPGSNESAGIPIQALMGALGWEVRDTPQAKRNFYELMNTKKL